MVRRFLRHHFDAPAVMAFCVRTGFAHPVALRIARGWERLIHPLLDASVPELPLVRLAAPVGRTDRILVCAANPREPIIELRDDRDPVHAYSHRGPGRSGMAQPGLGSGPDVSRAERVVADFLMPREPVRPDGPVMDLTIGGLALCVCTSAERQIRANASGAAADCRQVLTPKGGLEDGHAR